MKLPIIQTTTGFLSMAYSISLLFSYCQKPEKNFFKVFFYPETSAQIRLIVYDSFSDNVVYHGTKSIKQKSPQKLFFQFHEAFVASIFIFLLCLGGFSDIVVLLEYTRVAGYVTNTKAKNNHFWPINSQFARLFSSFCNS